MIAFGGLAGLEESVEEDNNLKVRFLWLWFDTLIANGCGVAWCKYLENNNRPYSSAGNFFQL